MILPVLSLQDSFATVYGADVRRVHFWALLLPFILLNYKAELQGGEYHGGTGKPNRQKSEKRIKVRRNPEFKNKRSFFAKKLEQIEEKNKNFALNYCKIA